MQNINDNAKLSEGVRESLIRVYDWLGLDSSTAWWNDQLSVRRLGHILEYVLLGIASGIAFIEAHRTRGILNAIGLCLFISVVDQVIKIFVPVRHFDVIDIGYDLIGAGLGIVLVTAVGLIVERKRA